MPKVLLSRVGGKVKTAGEAVDLFLCATSFETRCLRGGELLKAGDVRGSIIFRYEDTLDTFLGQEHTRQLRRLLESSKIACDVLDCSFKEPYSVVRRMNEWIGVRANDFGEIRRIIIDITCFTKLHLLLLLRYLREWFPESRLYGLYTEPLSYASSFGRELSYGIFNTFYIPYTRATAGPGQAALFLFLGHELIRGERILDEVEPELAVLIEGIPGYSAEIRATAERVNQPFLARVQFDHKFRLLRGSPREFGEVTEMLLGLVSELESQGFSTFYLAPLGTKLQALAFDELVRLREDLRFVLAYSLPNRYERRYYSQGMGPSWEWEFMGKADNERVVARLVEVEGVYYDDPFEIPLVALGGQGDVERGRTKEILMVRHEEVIADGFATTSSNYLVMADGRIFRSVNEEGEEAKRLSRQIEGELGRRSFVVSREEFLKWQRSR